MSAEEQALADGALATLAAGGHATAFAEIVRRHKQPLYRLIVAQVRDPDEALDLVQETFVSAHRALSRFDVERSLAAWLSRIAINKCRDWARRRRVRRFWSMLLPIEAGADTAEEAVGSDVQAADREELRIVGDAIAALPASLREPLLLQAVEGLSQAEVAEALGISAKAVELRVRRARATLADNVVSRSKKL